MTDPRYCAECGAALVPPSRSDHKPMCPRCGWFHPTNARLDVLAPAQLGHRLPRARGSLRPVLFQMPCPDIRPSPAAPREPVPAPMAPKHLAARSLRLVGTIEYEDKLLICVTVAVDDVSPRPGSDVDEVRLAPPDLALTPPDWPARTLIEQELFARGA